MTAVLDAELPVVPEWYARANCRGVGPDMFYGERGDPQVQALAVCRGCVVRDDCLRLALERCETFGVWGGCSQKQLRAIRSRRAS